MMILFDDWYRRYRYIFRKLSLCRLINREDCCEPDYNQQREVSPLRACPRLVLQPAVIER